jgi:hypothetical protein
VRGPTGTRRAKVFAIAKKRADEIPEKLVAMAMAPK